jgi:hypothetical protein
MLKKTSLIIILAASFGFAADIADTGFSDANGGFIAGKFKEERLRLDEINKNYIWRKHEGIALPEYEKLVFNAMWKFVAVGEATLELRGFDDIGGRKAHHIYSYAKSKPFFDVFFKVRDENEAWLDEESKVSLRYVSKISEGGWKKDEMLHFNHPEETFLLYDNGKMKMGKIPSGIQDVLSALYYVRTLDIETGDSYTVDAHSGDLSWPLTIKVLRKETVKVPAGEFKCFVLEPGIRKNAGITNTSGKMLVWVTADEKKMPVFLRVKIPIIGSVVAELAKIEQQSAQATAGAEENEN